jgi:predicted dehydrogenase
MLTKNLNILNKMLKVGIAGYGIVGKRRRACVDSHPDMKVVAVCDQIFESRGVFSDGVRYYTNFIDLLTDDLDALIVCLTNDINPDATIAGLERDLHVFCEKPPGRDLEDIARVMRVESKRPNLCLMYGFNHRYHDSVQDAIKIIRSGELGRIINLRGVYGKSKIITYNQTDWRTKRPIAGGGVLLDQGIHMLDLMRLFAGEFTQVHSIVSNAYWGFDVEDNAYVLMKTDDGIVGMLNSSATQWRHRFNLDINLERGSIILGGLLTGTKSYGAETLTVATVDHATSNGDPKEQVTRYNHDPSWELEIDRFADCILRDVPIEHGTSKDAFNTMRLVSQIYFSDSSWRNQYQLLDPKHISYE